MYKSNFVPKQSLSIGERRVFDTSFLADYAINEAGHIRSDFAVLNEQNDNLANFRLLQKIEEYKMQDINKDKSVEQILSEIKPRMVETPAERDRFEQYCLDNALSYYKSLQKSDVAKLVVGEGDKPAAGEGDKPAAGEGDKPAAGVGGSSAE